MPTPRQRLSRRDEAAPPAATGMDPNSLLSMLSSLYAIQQDQRDAPMRAHHAELQNQLAEQQLAQAPQLAAQQAELNKAQIGALQDRATDLPHGIEYLPPDVQQMYFDRQFPQRAVERKRGQEIKDTQDYNTMQTGAGQGPTSPEMFTAIENRFGTGTAEYFKSLFGGAKPGATSTTLGKVGTGVHAFATKAPQMLQGAEDAYTNAGSQFWSNLLGLPHTDIYDGKTVNPLNNQPFQKVAGAPGYAPSGLDWYDKLTQFLSK